MCGLSCVHGIEGVRAAWLWPGLGFGERILPIKANKSTVMGSWLRKR